MLYDESSIKRNIQKYRIKAGLSQEQLAKITGLSRTYISDVERNSRKMPSMESLHKIAEALNTTVDNILRDTLAYYQPEPNDSLSKEIATSLHFKTEKDLKLILNFIENLINKI